MKKTFYFLLLAMMFISSCQPKPKTVQFDAVATKVDLTKTIDQMYLSYNTRDIQKEMPPDP